MTNGDWLDGDVVIGLLRKNNDNGFGIEGKEWYQIVADAGERAGNRICELVTIRQTFAELKAILNDPISMNRIPRSEVYLYCEDAVVGPFVPMKYHLERAVWPSLLRTEVRKVTSMFTTIGVR